MADVVQAKKRVQKEIRARWLEKYAQNMKRQQRVSEVAGRCTLCYNSPCLVQCALQYEPRPKPATPRRQSTYVDRLEEKRKPPLRTLALTDGVAPTASASPATPVAPASASADATPRKPGKSRPLLLLPPPLSKTKLVVDVSGTGLEEQECSKPPASHSQRRRSRSRRRSSYRTESQNRADIADPGGAGGADLSGGRRFDAVLAWLLREKLFIFGNGLRTGLGSLVQSRREPSAKRGSVWRSFSDYQRSKDRARPSNTSKSPSAACGEELPPAPDGDLARRWLGDELRRRAPRIERPAAEREYYAMAFPKIVAARHSSAARVASNRRQALRSLLAKSGMPSRFRGVEASQGAANAECRGTGRCFACSNESLFLGSRQRAGTAPPRPFESYLELERLGATSRTPAREA